MNNLRTGVALLVFGALPLFAEETLERWITQAVENNPTLIAAEKKWDAAREHAKRVSDLEDPMVGVDVERMDSTGFGDYNNTEWMASQTVPWFGKRKSQKNAAELEAEVAGFQRLELVRKIRSDVIQAHADLWLTQTTLGIMGENKKLLEQVKESALAQYESGSSMQADVLRAGVELAELENDIITMERELEIAQAAINALLNESQDTPRKLARDLKLPKLDLSLNELKEHARRYCCILMSFLRAKEAKEETLKVARLEGKPDIEFRVEARQFEESGTIDEYDTGVFLNFPWLWRGKYRAMVREAKADLDMAEAEFDAEVNRTLLEIREKYTMTDAARRQIQLYEKTILPQAEQLVASSQAAYQANQASLLELLEAEHSAREAKIGYARARADYVKNYAKLNQITEPWGPSDFATGLVTRDMK